MSFFKSDKIFFFFVLIIGISIKDSTPIILGDKRKDLLNNPRPFSKQFHRSVVRIIADKDFKDPLNDIWTCGGSIIGYFTVITSAACAVQPEIKTKYVAYGTSDLGKNFRSICVTIVVKTIINPNYAKVNQKEWRLYDVAIFKTEKSMVSNLKCEFRPSLTFVTDSQDFEAPNINAVTFGWGTDKFSEGSTATTKVLKYANVKIAEFHNCLSLQLNPSTWLIPSTICSVSEADFDYYGRLLNKTLIDCKKNARNDGKCQENPKKQEQNEPPELEQSPVPTPNDTKYADEVVARFDVQIVDMLGLFRQRIKAKKHRVTSATKLKTTTKPKNDARMKLKVGREGSTMPPLQPGICLNDHGGPLFTWRGLFYVLIGLNTGYRIRKNTMECVGPFWYTSIVKNFDFIYCAVKKLGYNISLKWYKNKQRRRSRYFLCDQFKLDSNMTA